MKYDEHTNIGGAERKFQTTRWTAIEAIQGNDSQKQALVGEMLHLYWKPVYCYLRQKGHNNDRAKDLTQGFFQEIVLGRDLIQRADQARGRFRTLLLTALDRYLTSEYRKQSAQKRIPEQRLRSFERVDPGQMPEVFDGLSSEETFNYAWISDLLDQILAEVKQECIERDMAVHWDVFRDRVLLPIMECEAPASMGDICEKYGIESPIKASNMIVAVKRRFQAAMRRHLRLSVASEDEVSEELGELIRFLTKKMQ